MNLLVGNAKTEGRVRIGDRDRDGHVREDPIVIEAGRTPSVPKVDITNMAPRRDRKSVA